MTHYQTLQIDKHASDVVIKAAYRALSMKFHPDKNPGNKQSTIKMQLINIAYSILSDATRRAMYDQTLVITPAKTYTTPNEAPRTSKPASQPKSKPDPEPDYEPAHEPNYNRPGREWGYGFEANQSKRKFKSKNEPKTGQYSESVPFQYHILNFLESIWGGIKSFSIVLWNVWVVMFWPILKWTVFGVFFLLVALLGCGGGGGGGSGRCRYDDRYRW